MRPMLVDTMAFQLVRQVPGTDDRGQGFRQLAESPLKEGGRLFQMDGQGGIDVHPTTSVVIDQCSCRDLAWEQGDEVSKG